MHPCIADEGHFAQAGTEIQRHFGFAATEELMEEFPCTLVQVAQCTHNPFTHYMLVGPASSAHDCEVVFNVRSRSNATYKLPGALPHASTLHCLCAK